MRQVPRVPQDPQDRTEPSETMVQLEFKDPRDMMGLRDRLDFQVKQVRRDPPDRLGIQGLLE